MRIQWYAMPADSWARSELHKPEWLRCRGVDDFPHVHPEFLADNLHFVDESDVDRAESVLQQLYQLRRFRAGHRYDGVETRRVKRGGNFGARGCNSADHLWRIFDVPPGVARIDALR